MRIRRTDLNVSTAGVSNCVGLVLQYVLTCTGLRLAAELHLKNTRRPAGLGSQVRGRKWCHAVHCCPVLFR